MESVPRHVLRAGHQHHRLRPDTTQRTEPTTIDDGEQSMISLYPQTNGDSFEPRSAVAAETRTPPEGRPWVMTNMIASADGATAVDGRSGSLGGPADKAMFSALRSVADGIVVGASTVREERYRPPTGDTESVGDGGEQPLAPRPLVVVITGSLDLDPSLPLFSDPSYRPLVITVASAPDERRRRLEAVADVIDGGQDRVDLSTALGALRRRGLAVLLSEGGPSLNGQLIAADLIDEWNLSLSPVLVAGSSRRPATGSEPLNPPARMSLARVWEQDELLFCRWVRSARPA